MVLLLLLKILVCAAGVALVARTLLSVVRIFLVPRRATDKLATFTFLLVRRVFNLWADASRPYAWRDRIMSVYAPIALLALLAVWLMLVLLGYMGIFWAIDGQPWRAAFIVSGSSLFTLGFAAAPSVAATAVTFSEATIGLVLVALLISYLPTMYSAFSRREAAVTLLEARAGSPPSAVEMLTRFHVLGRLDALTELWVSWEAWFADVQESHTSLIALIFFRSTQPGRSWVTAAGAVLDAAALASSTLDLPRDPQAELCIRMGYLTLRYIADLFRIPYLTEPRPGDPISVTRQEFDAAYDRLAAAGVALKPDRERAWRDFAGWRVNYDTALLALARLTIAPYAPWSSDRSIAMRVPALLGRDPTIAGRRR